MLFISRNLFISINIMLFISSIYSRITYFLALAQVITTVATLNPDCNDLKDHKNFRLLLKGEECPVERIKLRMMGGEDSDMGEFPWTVLLLIHVESFKDKPFCSGSILNSKYVITAAHCIASNEAKFYEIVVRVGEYNLNTEEDCDDGVCAPPPITYRVEEYIPHPQWVHGSNDYDLALLRVKGEMQWNDYVYPACLPLSCALLETSFKGKSLVAAGFGALHDGPNMKASDILQKVWLHGVDSDVCVQNFTKIKLTGDLIICAGGSEGGDLYKDACHGDSGAPLIYHNFQDTPPRPYVVGLVSGGEACNSRVTSQPPGIYTRLASHMHWLLDNIRE